MLGEFEKLKKPPQGQVFGEMACGIAAKATLKPASSEKIEMSLVWHMPNVTFPENSKPYRRFYTEYYGGEEAVLRIANYALDSYNEWDQKIYDWQKDVLENR